MIKNTAGQFVAFQLLDATDGSNVTTGSPTVYLTKDGGTQATGSGAVAHEGNGQWSYACAQADTDANHVAFTIVLAGSISQTVNLYPKALPPTAEQISGQMSANIENDDNGWDTALYNFVTNYMLSNGIANQPKQDTIIASIVQPVRQIIRTSDDTNPIFFEWENNSTTFTVGNQKVYIDGGTVQTIAGAISFAYTTPLGKHIYKIAHNAADRPVGKGVAAYWINQNSIEVPIALSVIPSKEDIAIETDARLLDAGDATDLIASIVSRIGNTNVDQTALVAAFRLALVNDPVPAASIVDKTGISSFNPATDTVVNVTNVANVTTSVPKQKVREALEGRWTDEEGGTFDLTIQDIA